MKWNFYDGYGDANFLTKKRISKLFEYYSYISFAFFAIGCIGIVSFFSYTDFSFGFCGLIVRCMFLGMTVTLIGAIAYPIYRYYKDYKAANAFITFAELKEWYSTVPDKFVFDNYSGSVYFIYDDYIKEKERNKFHYANFPNSNLYTFTKLCPATLSDAVKIKVFANGIYHKIMEQEMVEKANVCTEKDKVINSIYQNSNKY